MVFNKPPPMSGGNSDRARNQIDRNTSDSLIRGRRMETRFRNQAQDVSYDLTSTFMVQAIAQIFNGSSSATRKIEELEAREHDDGSNKATGDPTGGKEGVSIQEIEEKEMHSILVEALECHDCTIQVTREAMVADVASGVYNPSIDPPFSHIIEEDVSPFDQPILRQCAGYRALATPSQLDQYMEQIHQCLTSMSSRSNSENSANGNNKSDKSDKMHLDDSDEFSEADIDLSMYCVNFHIHQHYLARRGVLNFCRTVEEMHDFRIWRWQMAIINRNIARLAAEKDVEEDEQQRQQQAQTRFPYPDEEADTEMSSPPPEAPMPPPLVPQVPMAPPSPLPSPQTAYRQLQEPIPHHTHPHSLPCSPTPPFSPSFDPYLHHHQRPYTYTLPTLPTTPPLSPSPQPSSSSISSPSSCPDLTSPATMHLSMSHQANLWRKRARARSQHLRAVRTKYAATMREREVQRQDGLKIAKYRAAIARMDCIREGKGPLRGNRKPEVRELLARMNR